MARLWRSRAHGPLPRVPSARSPVGRVSCSAVGAASHRVSLQRGYRPLRNIRRGGHRLEQTRAGQRERFCRVSTSKPNELSTTALRTNGTEKVDSTGDIPSSEREPRSIADLVVQIRDHRMGLIQTPQQLRFCWQAIVDWIRKADPKTLASSSRKRPSDAAEPVADSKQKRFVLR